MLNKILKVFFLLSICFCGVFSTGYNFDGLEIGLERTIILETLGTFFLFITLSLLISHKSIKIIFFIYLFTTTIYFPIGYLYGAPNFKVIGGALEADGLEIVEFLEFIPKYIFFIQFIYCLFSIFSWKIIVPFFLEIKKISLNYHKYFIFISLLFVSLPLILASLFKENFIEKFRAYEVNMSIYPIGFYIDLFFAPYVYWKKKKNLMTQVNLPATWHIEKKSHNLYKNYVLIIGESARADYLHAYGFPIENTPFLSDSKALIIDGYISTAEYTLLSLPQTLSIKNPNSKSFDDLRLSHNNIVSLAKMAGFRTAWLSNQGMFGKFANEVSIYAQRSDMTYFTQRGDYQNSHGISDRLLLPPFEKFLNQESNEPRLIVLHLMGSHHDFCKRLDHPSPFEFKSKKISCYVGTIKQTDDFIRDVVKILENKNEPWSLVYFSDHGLKHTGMADELTLQHGGDTYESFYVPLIKLSSDDHSQRKVKVQRSAFYFLTGFAQWLGLDVIELRKENYDFWSNQDDLPDKSNNLKHVLSLPKDPY